MTKILLGAKNLAMMPSSLGQRIRHARQLAEISARELDRLAGLSEGHTALLESVAKGATAETASKIARVVGVTLDWLILGAGSDPTERSIRAAIARARSSQRPAA